MFPVGALNPQPGNQAREQLVNALAQELARRRQAQQQQVATPAAGFFDFMHRRQQQQMQALNGASRPEGAGTQTALTALTNARAILPFLRGALGAAAPRTDAGFASPGHDVPVPQAPGGYVPPAHGAPMAPAPGGTMSPLTTPVPSAPSAGGGVIAPGSTFAGQAGMRNAGVGSSIVNSAGGSLSTTPSGLVPIQPGVFLNPSTGEVFGAVPSHALNIGV